jgi:NTP pyrophosphatase (non-canonical NTP hydrolase)
VRTKHIVALLDGANLKTREEYGLRILKVCEEAGEAAQAWIGYTGQNPRKGQSHTKEDVCQELADVIITALVALESISQNSQTVTLGRIRYVETRFNREAE